MRKRLLEEFGIEIGGGLGAFKGKAWRIGLMGESATDRHVSCAARCIAPYTRTVRQDMQPAPGAGGLR